MEFEQVRVRAPLGLGCFTCGADVDIVVEATADVLFDRNGVIVEWDSIYDEFVCDYGHSEMDKSEIDSGLAFYADTQSMMDLEWERVPDKPGSKPSGPVATEWWRQPLGIDPQPPMTDRYKAMVNAEHIYVKCAVERDSVLARLQKLSREIRSVRHRKAHHNPEWVATHAAWERWRDIANSAYAEWRQAVADHWCERHLGYWPTHAQMEEFKPLATNDRAIGKVWAEPDAIGDYGPSEDWRTVCWQRGGTFRMIEDEPPECVAKKDWRWAAFRKFGCSRRLCDEWGLDSAGREFHEDGCYDCLPKAKAVVVDMRGAHAHPMKREGRSLSGTPLNDITHGVEVLLWLFPETGPGSQRPGPKIETIPPGADFIVAVELLGGQQWPLPWNNGLPGEPE